MNPPEVFLIEPAGQRTLVTFGIVFLLLAGILGAMGYFTYSARATRFVLGPEGLSIRGTLYGRTIPWSALRVEEARLVDLRETPELQPTFRTNGIGTPGYGAGWFRLRRAGRGLLFLTDRSRVVAIPTTQGYTLLLSPRDPAALLDGLRRHLPNRPPAP